MGYLVGGDVGKRMSLSSFATEIDLLSKCSDHPPLHRSTSVEEAEAWNKVIRENCSPTAARQHLRWFGRNDLYFLMVYLLRRPDRKGLWDFLRCQEVQNDPDGFMDMWARGSGKSTIISWALAIQDGLNHPNKSTAWFSHNRPIAKSFLRIVKTELEENSELISLFPDVLWENPKLESPKWSENEELRLKRIFNTPEETYE